MQVYGPDFPTPNATTQYMVSQQERKGKRGSMNSSVSSMLKPAPKFASIQPDSLGGNDLMNVMSSTQLRQK